MPPLFRCALNSGMPVIGVVFADCALAAALVSHLILRPFFLMYPLNGDSFSCEPPGALLLLWLSLLCAWWWWWWWWWWLNACWMTKSLFVLLA